MWTRKELKSTGMAAFKANYWPNVIVAFLMYILMAGASSASVGSKNSSDSQQQATDLVNSLSERELAVVAAAALGLFALIFIIALLLDLFLVNPLKVGCYGFLRENVRTGKGDLNIITTGFDNYKRSFITMLLRSVYLALWSMLFIIPGLVKTYSYRMVPFIVRDDPELSPKEVIDKSRQMMNGQKWNAFKLDLSFLGWEILSVLTLGILGVFYVDPYIRNTNAALYLRLRGEEISGADNAEAIA